MSTATVPLPVAGATTSGPPAPRTRLGEPARRRPTRGPRASTALAVLAAVFAALFPGALPHGPILQGGTVGLFLLAALGLTRLLRRPVPRVTGVAHRVVLGLTALALAATVGWFEVTQNAMRAAVGWAPAGPGYWAVLLAVVTVVGGLVAGTGWVRRHRRSLARATVAQARRHWRPAVALPVAAAVLVPATGVQGATASPAAPARSEQVLQRRSPSGAVRVYAELRDGEDVAARARRAADQLVRAGGLATSRVVLVVPTGSGWVDENAVRGLEHRFRGDVATVGLQYAQVPSWVAYLFDRSGAEQAARALFHAVERRVAQLPADRRPDLHVYGESLGATAGQAIFAGSPSAAQARREVCSVLWVGPPGGDTVGLPRETVVANDDDPIVHGGPALLWSPPEDDRPWLPGVSFLQAGVDFIGSLAMPDGSGHRYGPAQARQLQTCG